MTELAYDYFNASAVAAPACVAANGDAPWRCLFGTEAISYVQSPYLLVQSQFDRAQLMYNAPRPGSSAASVSYANKFQAATREMLSVVPTATQPRSALFAPACFSYCTSLSANFWNVRAADRLRGRRRARADVHFCTAADGGAGWPGEELGAEAGAHARPGEHAGRGKLVVLQGRGAAALAAACGNCMRPP
jgi:hypothetical protein